jgi:hypothetical protein
LDDKTQRLRALFLFVRLRWVSFHRRTGGGLALTGDRCTFWGQQTLERISP